MKGSKVIKLYATNLSMTFNVLQMFRCQECGGLHASGAAWLKASVFRKKLLAICVVMLGTLFN